MIFLKRAVSPVVATALLLVVAVSAVVGFSGWFSEFNSNLFVDVESDSYSSSSVRVEGIFNDVLYLKSNSNSNLNLLSIMDSNNVEICNINNKTNNYSIDSTNLLLNFENLVIDDISILNNSVNLIGNISCDTGKILNKGCRLNGDNQYIQINNKSILSGNELSFSIWLKFSHLDGSSLQHILYAGDNNGDGFGIDDELHLSLFTNNKLTFRQYRDYGLDFSINSETEMNTNVYYNVVGVINNTSVKLYINGEFSNSSMTVGLKTINWENWIRIGRHNGLSYPERNFNGTINQFQIYSKVLTNEEIKLKYQFDKNNLFNIIHKNKINKFNLLFCNLNKNEKYNVLGFTNLADKIDVEVIPQ